MVRRFHYLVVTGSNPPVLIIALNYYVHRLTSISALHLHECRSVRVNRISQAKFNGLHGFPHLLLIDTCVRRMYVSVMISITDLLMNRICRLQSMLLIPIVNSSSQNETARNRKNMVISKKKDRESCHELTSMSKGKLQNRQIGIIIPDH